MYALYFGNKNYSSWSLRPWVLMKHFEIPFEEHQVQVSGKGAHAGHRGYSANGLVPCLHVDGFQVWDTLAIAEFLAERHSGLWPADPLARARARSVACEMHSGFGAVRSAMPMNIKLLLKGKPPSAEVQADIDRIAEIWTQTRSEFAGDAGPYLFGAFSVADAMFAPVVMRFVTYNVALPPVAEAYRDAMLAHPAMVEWADAARAETVALPAYDAVVEAYGGAR
ncbi:MAG: glutathione S-transferase family protein [Rhodocyclaceae bacterium]|nr:glutathione S-transferase family protein [Rhodocyclaceae bacterium]HQU88620.1 glutathione S-transferase family protein [Denitromonas sp.]